jgi:two-component system chemotaxis response regulator CheB
MINTVKVLVVDDSAVAREILQKGLTMDPGIEVVGKASDVYSARDRIVQLKPDVVTLDIQMPGMDGIEFLKRLLPQYPIPVIVVSSLTVEGSRHALDALEAGAVDVVSKPAASDPEGLSAMLADLCEKVKVAARIEFAKIHPRAVPVARQRLASVAGASDRIVAIGASTGGTTALTQVISALPADFPPVLIVQHMPPVFTRMFADSLGKASKLEVREAVDGDRPRPGLVLVAPGNFHLSLSKAQGTWVVRCTSGPLVSGHRPSVDVLFHSVALAAKEKAVGALLTGMGKDGADGLLAMRGAGARCLAQDEASSVVFGMPKAAWDNGAAECLVGLDQVPEALVGLLTGDPAKGG